MDIRDGVTPLTTRLCTTQVDCDSVGLKAEDMEEAFDIVNIRK